MNRLKLLARKAEQRQTELRDGINRVCAIGEPTKSHYH